VKDASVARCSVDDLLIRSGCTASVVVTLYLLSAEENVPSVPVLAMYIGIIGTKWINTIQGMIKVGEITVSAVHVSKAGGGIKADTL